MLSPCPSPVGGGQGEGKKFSFSTCFSLFITYKSTVFSEFSSFEKLLGIYTFLLKLWAFGVDFANERKEGIGPPGLAKVTLFFRTQRGQRGAQHKHAARRLVSRSRDFVLELLSCPH